MKRITSSFMDDTVFVANFPKKPLNYQRNNRPRKILTEYFGSIIPRNICCIDRANWY